MTDDELESLLATVHRTPRSDTVRAVARGLVRRRRFAEAADLLTSSLRTIDDPRIWSLLAHACLGATRHQQALTALQQVDCDPATHHENARLLVLALERLHRGREARSLARRVLEHHPDDPVCLEALQRLDLAVTPVARSALDPFYTVRRAEQYVSIGRIDRAMHVYRRIQLNHPGDPGIAARMAALARLRTTAPRDLALDLPPPGIDPAPPATLLEPGLDDDSEDAPTVNLDGSEGRDGLPHRWRPVRDG